MSPQSAIACRIIDFFRKRYPTTTAEHVSSDTGVHADTVQKWLDRGSAPSAAILKRLIEVYGPAFLAALFSDLCPEWIMHSVKWEQIRLIDKQIDDLQAERDNLLKSPF